MNHALEKKPIGKRNKKKEWNPTQVGGLSLLDTAIRQPRRCLRHRPRLASEVIQHLVLFRHLETPWPRGCLRPQQVLALLVPAVQLNMEVRNQKDLLKNLFMSFCQR